MKILKQHHIEASQEEQLLHLWNREYPEGIAQQNLETFRQYLKSLGRTTHFLLTEDDGSTIQAWTFSFDRDSERWFGIIVSEAMQGKGWGKLLLEMIKECEQELNGWVSDLPDEKTILGKTYKSPLAFYKKCGFQVIEKERLEKENISAVKIRWKKK